MSLTWTPEQERARDAVAAFTHPMDPRQVFYLDGPAGTGKSTLISSMVDPDRWLFASFTGKSASVMRAKGCANASTIHSMIYRPNGESKEHEVFLLRTRITQLEGRVNHATRPLSDAEVKELGLRRIQLKTLLEDRRPQYALWANSPLADANIDGVVVDECSMVDERLGRDLESFGKKVLVQGDRAQLPPVAGAGWYVNRTPDFALTEVHRQAKESGILRLATDIREGRGISACDWGDVVVRRRGDFASGELRERVMLAGQVICGRNATRIAANTRHREWLGRTSAAPQPGDRVVCLRNSREYGIFNGEQFTVVESDNDLNSLTSDLEIAFDDDPGKTLRIVTWLHHMVGKKEELMLMDKSRRDLQEFDWAYCLTTHKAQGSQWSDVVVIDESAAFKHDARRWLYTATTRAAKKLTVVLP